MSNCLFSLFHLLIYLFCHLFSNGCRAYVTAEGWAGYAPEAAPEFLFHLQLGGLHEDTVYKPSCHDEVALVCVIKFSEAKAHLLSAIAIILRVQNADCCILWVWLFRQHVRDRLTSLQIIPSIHGYIEVCVVTMPIMKVEPGKSRAFSKNLAQQWRIVINTPLPLSSLSPLFSVL